ncbi:acyl-CoA synthetase/AMP-acid ligase [Caldisphaera lagunensis DSM 15908]|uniref:acetate--CoA ligase n=1 Tax=Caldisphaera lagunensis (strain DSM 15908 / JCM 11604 / ANMR 0165 / IC-154) TaxID=1056495 RepID=L0A7V7_CALLD|nr:AMP-binding protein [Caldisphaera lagunensis]AFZ69916.1 acyl-CoA synthetase/AMP-acid ligase [Caldisphaera lagunensis DSM 15908]
MVYIWSPPKDLINSANVTEFMEKNKIENYNSLVKKSQDDLKWFWGNLPDWLGLEWFRKFDEVYDTTQGIEWTKWYLNGKINISYNALDRIIKNGFGNKTAMIWYGEDGKVVKLSYIEMLEKVNKLSNYLTEIGVKKGDVISIYAPLMPETVISMYAAFRLGAIANPIFSGFAPDAVAERLKAANSKVLITSDGYYRKGKIIELKKSADEAVERSNVSLKVIVARRFEKSNIPWNDNRDIWFDDAINGKRPEFEAIETDAEDPALLMFTSGTTGNPKGAVISQIGTILQPAKEHYFNLDIKTGFSKENDILWWITDIGWMMGPWQVIGTQILGASHFSLEGALDYPNKDKVWKLIEDFKITHLGFAATAARLLKALGNEGIEKHDLSSLRAFGNTGEPIDEDTWFWVMRDVGKEQRPLINLSGGTEILGCFLLPSVVVSLKPSTLWGPGLGMSVEVYDDYGNPVRNKPGYLVATKPSPSMTRGLWKDPKRYIETYWNTFKGVWFHGDYALIDEDGYWYILGRADDVIKVAGKRIGPAELETIINAHNSVAESACIGYPDPIKGEVIVCFAIPKPGKKLNDKEINEIKNMVSTKLGKPFEPEKIIEVKDLPRTRSGKIMRRIIRDIAKEGKATISPVVENPDSVEEIKRAVSELKKLMK